MTGQEDIEITCQVVKGKTRREAEEQVIHSVHRAVGTAR